MIKEVHFKQTTNFTGRNGYMKCGGIEIGNYAGSKNVLISALTSRGEVGRCDISVPIDSIPELIAALSEAMKYEPSQTI